jgi:hypothetical protein
MNKKIARMIALHLQGKLTDLEYAYLDAWVTTSEKNMKMFLKLTDRKFRNPDAGRHSRVWRKVQQNIISAKSFLSPSIKSTQ